MHALLRRPSHPPAARGEPGRPSPLAWLRQGTRDLHAQVEATPRMRAAVPEAPQVVDVAALLTASARFVPALEAHLACALPHAGLDAWRPSLNRTPALEADLGRVPRTRLPCVLPERDMPGVLGVLYVLEGSRLGLRAIAARVEREGGAHATAYLDCRLPPPLSWAALCGRIDTLTPRAAGRCVDGARAAFRAVLEALDAPRGAR